jgi:hypothetical protein
MIVWFFKQSTSHKELVDHKNKEFKFTEPRILNKQYRNRFYFNLKFDSDFIWKIRKLTVQLNSTCPKDSNDILIIKNGLTEHFLWLLQDYRGLNQFKTKYEFRPLWWRHGALWFARTNLGGSGSGPLDLNRSERSRSLGTGSI